MVNNTSSNANNNKRSNALIHGVYAREIIQPGESEADFNKLHADLEDDLNPQGRSEEEALFDVAHLTWLKRRVVRMEQNKLKESPLLAEFGSALRQWPDILEDIKPGQKSDQALDAAKEALTLLQSVSKYLERKHFGRSLHCYVTEHIHQARPLLDQLQDLFDKSIAPSLAAPGTTTPEAADQAADLAVIEASINLITMIDARLDKALSRLFVLQDQKRLMTSAI